jgi:murein L,D-transpeptidase YcbB/YkuD
MNGEQTLQVNLPRPIPVLIVYATAIVEDDGKVHFFDDVYGLDQALAGALAVRNH